MSKLRDLAKAINMPEFYRIYEYARILDSNEISSEELLLPIDGVTVLQSAALKGNLHAFKLIVEKNVNTLDSACSRSQYLYWTILHFAAGGNGLDKDVEEIFKIVEEKRPRIVNNAYNFAVGNNQTLLHLAAKQGKISICNLLIKVIPGAIDVADRDGLTPIHYAISNGHNSVFASFLDKLTRKQINDVYGNEGTLLTYTIKCGNEGACQNLIPRLSPDQFTQSVIEAATGKEMYNACRYMNDQVSLKEATEALQQAKDREAALRQEIKDLQELNVILNSHIVNLANELNHTRNKFPQQEQLNDEASLAKTDEPHNQLPDVEPTIAIVGEGPVDSGA